MSDYDQISIMIVDDEMGHIAEKTISHRDCAGYGPEEQAWLAECTIA